MVGVSELSVCTLGIKYAKNKALAVNKGQHKPRARARKDVVPYLNTRRPSVPNGRPVSDNFMALLAHLPRFLLAPLYNFASKGEGSGGKGDIGSIRTLPPPFKKRPKVPNKEKLLGKTAWKRNGSVVFLSLSLCRGLLFVVACFGREGFCE